MSDMKDFVIENGVLKKYKGSDRYVMIPDHVTSIGNEAFWCCRSLTSVKIPNSVMRIGGGAFSKCSSLATVLLPDSVEYIGNGAFYETQLYNNDDNWKDNVLYIANHLIQTNWSIEGHYTIRPGTKTIAGNAFRYREKLTGVTIPDSIISIGDSAFDTCRSLTRICITDLSAWCSISFFDRTSNPLSRPNSELYINEMLATSLTIPSGVAKINSFAFSGYKALTDVTILDGVMSIGNYAFWGCHKLKSVKIPNSVTKLGKWAFMSCNLETIIYSGDSQVFSKDLFGGWYPEELTPQLREHWTNLTNVALKDLVLVPKVWETLSEERKMEIYFSRQAKTLLSAYFSIINEQDAQAIAERFVGILSSSPSAKDCNSAADCMTAFSEKVPTTLLQTMYDLLKKTKNGKKACQTIEKDGLLMRKLV